MSASAVKLKTEQEMSIMKLLAGCPNCGRTLHLSLSAADAAKGAIYVDEDGNVYG